MCCQCLSEPCDAHPPLPLQWLMQAPPLVLASAAGGLLGSAFNWCVGRSGQGRAGLWGWRQAARRDRLVLLVPASSSVPDLVFPV